MKLLRFHANARHLVLDAFECQISPATADTGYIQARHPTRGTVDNKMQTTGGAK
ncbi:Uncharacterised protein [Yersinia enterocolitica]|nr:Uncharacterised protein [Yersinia enterocolitica]